ncbi:MerR family transcriptional regulator [Rhodococcus sp. 1R11]|uniref:MerR family transcriptional regulator n=1 Tax=Rhodococcus sp. 1R11 TaxID=2559614 RepID=UPI00107218AF|nr:MerR family transcriptional regulator [Rhodococcus sp. 1R11]TFI43663.1 MerR family transcriptional regulator [Rhodococcus sp. 1R11]
MLIGELAKRTGVSARSLRHYEQRHLLVPRRDSNGYRHYDESAVGVVEQIHILISAGLTTEVIERYVDCVDTGADKPTLHVCPTLRVELERTADCLRIKRSALEATERRLAALWPSR